MEQEYWPSRQEVYDKIHAAWQPAPVTEQISVVDALGRVTAEDLTAIHGLPVVRASSMDGIGVSSVMFAQGIPDTSTWQRGREYDRTDTGDDFDDRYDAVIAIEMVTELASGGIQIDQAVTVKKGMNIRPASSYFAKGDPIVHKGSVLTPSDLAALVMGGITTITVIRKPVVAFIPTGSELIPAGEIPGRGKNIDSNSILVANMLPEMGAVSHCFPIVKDNWSALESTLSQALDQADIIILNGGSSKGGEDYNADLLKAKGTLLCHNVAAAPGRPICIAVIDGKLVINLPGPSIACYYGMDWCVRFAVNTWLMQPMPKRRTIPVRLTEDITYHTGMEILCKMEIRKTAEGYEGRQAPFRASTVIENLVAPGQFITDPRRNCHPAGEVVMVELLKE